MYLKNFEVFNLLLVKNYLIVALVFFLFSNKPVYAQDIKQDQPNITFGKVESEDFSLKGVQVDTSLGAVIIAEVGKTYFKGNNKGFLDMIYKVQKRIRIINKKGFALGNVTVSLYNSTDLKDKERLADFQAITYNLEGGQVISTALEKKDLFMDKVDKNHTEQKFSMAKVKDGSILEYSYTIVSDYYFNLQPWSFQGEFPVVWSEYTVDIPYLFEYVFITHGFNPFYLETHKHHNENYRIIETSSGSTLGDVTGINLPSTNNLSRWVMVNIPALKPERYISSMENYNSSLEFQLSATISPNQVRDEHLGTWSTRSKRLLENKDFGYDLVWAQDYLNGPLKELRDQNPLPLDLAKAIFRYARTVFIGKGIRGIYLSQPISTIFKSKTGYSEEINLLLILMLKHEHFNVNPFILSTRNHGYANSNYPLIDEYNYVLAEVEIDGKTYLLDASEPYLGFNKLPDYCYNGDGVVINEADPKHILLSPDSVLENSYTTFLLNSVDGSSPKWSGTLNRQYGEFGSNNIRSRIHLDGEIKWKKDYKESIKFHGTNFHMDIDSISLINPSDFEQALKLKYNISLNGEKSADIIYFNPIWDQEFSNNPFKSEERKYPVELGEKLNFQYIFQMDIPKGYKVEDLPKSSRSLLNENEGVFEYLINQTDNTIQIRTKIKINKSIFTPDNYSILRNFFNSIEKKYSEQIVFKKL